MLKDIHFRFTGFHGSAGRCHLRLVRLDKSRPLVIVCSQYNNYYGTSVTNAMEIIAGKLFSAIANGAFEGVAFDGELPTLEEWHDDVNVLDKCLAHLHPAKYRARFSSCKLKIPELFARVLWIEHYADNRPAYTCYDSADIVTMDSEGRPAWREIPEGGWLEQRTGFSKEQLLPNLESLDLSKIEAVPDEQPHPATILADMPGYHHVRWTKELIDFIPALIYAGSMQRGRPHSHDEDEPSIQNELERFFALRLPARELFVREYQFGHHLNLQQRGKPKALDFAIFSPDGRTLDAVLEVKRTSSRSPDLHTAVLKDIARLLLMSKATGCTCYFLLCGEVEIITKCLDRLARFLAKANSTRIVSHGVVYEL